VAVDTGRGATRPLAEQAEAAHLTCKAIESVIDGKSGTIRLALTVLLAEGVFTGLGISYEVATESSSLESLLYRAVQTARGQRTSFGLLIPPFMMSGSSACRTPCRRS